LSETSYASKSTAESYKVTESGEACAALTIVVRMNRSHLSEAVGLFIDIEYMLIYIKIHRDTIRQGGPTSSSADVSVPRLAGFSL
jgi:hypothetical protein